MGDNLSIMCKSMVRYVMFVHINHNTKRKKKKFYNFKKKPHNVHFLDEFISYY
jgi:hypothetical protein